MAQLTAKAQRLIPCSPAKAFNIIADVHNGQRMLLTEHYHDYTVLGADSGPTVLTWTLHIGTHKRPYRMAIERVILGQLLAERDTLSSFTMTWRLDPEGDFCKVTLESVWEQRSHGFPALFERVFAPRSLTRIYTTMLSRLASLSLSDDLPLSPAVAGPEDSSVSH
ncbi:MAG: SRPBCC family protein [Chloroflexi bacterium]|nr:SRPBCC family protein [Chloroflexota bacterium]MCL4544182.1 SRPBCC family protein [Chloroflexota bacterium]